MGNANNHEETKATASHSSDARSEDEGPRPSMTTSSVENWKSDQEPESTSSYNNANNKLSKTTIPQKIMRPVLRKTFQGALVQAGSDPIFSSPDDRSSDTSPAFAKKQLKSTGFGNVLKKGADVPCTQKRVDPNERLGQVYKSVSLRKAGNPDAARPKPIDRNEHLGDLYKSVSLKKSPTSSKEKVPTTTATCTATSTTLLPNVTLHKTGIIKPKNSPKSNFELPPEFSIAKQNLKHRIEKPTFKSSPQMTAASSKSTLRRKGTSMSGRPTKNLRPGSKEYYQEIKQRRGLSTGRSKSGSMYQSFVVGLWSLFVVLVVASCFLSIPGEQVPKILQPFQNRLWMTTNHQYLHDACMWFDTNTHVLGFTQRTQNMLLQVCPEPPVSTITTAPIESTASEDQRRRRQQLQHDVSQKVQQTDSETKAPEEQYLNQGQRGPKWIHRLFRSHKGSTVNTSNKMY